MVTEAVEAVATFVKSVMLYAGFVVPVVQDGNFVLKLSTVK